MRVKICGITKPDQGRAIVHMGATALGFICVRQSPRYVSPEQIRAVVDALPTTTAIGQRLNCIGVFADATLSTICQTAAIAALSGIQLHGRETPEFCVQLRQNLPSIEIIKTIRVRDPTVLSQAAIYADCANTLLLDAYDPNALGGTGKTLDWLNLQKHFHPSSPWLLAGGLTPENILEALRQVHPDGIDLSSGVERAPGDKDLEKVAQLFRQLALNP